MYLESVVREVSDGESLHESCAVGQPENHSSLGNYTELRVRRARPAHPPQAHVRECMVEAEIGMRHEVQSDGHLQGSCHSSKQNPNPGGLMWRHEIRCETRWQHNRSVPFLCTSLGPARNAGRRRNCDVSLANTAISEVKTKGQIQALHQLCLMR